MTKKVTLQITKIPNIQKEKFLREVVLFDDSVATAATGMPNINKIISQCHNENVPIFLSSMQTAIRDDAGEVATLVCSRTLIPDYHASAFELERSVQLSVCVPKRRSASVIRYFDMPRSASGTAAVTPHDLDQLLMI